MTRFWVDANEAVYFVLTKMAYWRKGLIYIPNLKSVSLGDLAKVIAPDSEWNYIGTRPGEKMHEELISPHEALRTKYAQGYPPGYVIEPDAAWHIPLNTKKVPLGFHYSSKDNLMTLEEIRDKL